MDSYSRFFGKIWGVFPGIWVPGSLGWDLDGDEQLPGGKNYLEKLFFPVFEHFFIHALGVQAGKMTWKNPFSFILSRIFP